MLAKQETTMVAAQEAPALPDASDLDQATFRFCTSQQTKFMLLTLLLIMLCSGLQAEVIGDAAPTIATFFKAETQITWMATAGSLTQLASVLLFGRAYDLFEPKIILLFCLCVSLAGTLLSALAKHYTMLICGQGLVGFGRAGVIVGNATLLAIICPDKKMRTFYLGIITGAYAIMIKVSPLIAGGLLAIKVKEAWRGIFWIAVPLQGILILMVCAFPSLRRQAAHWRQLRELGPWRVLLHAASVVGLLLPLTGGQFSGTLDFTGSVLVVCYVLGPILFAAFLVADIRKPEETRMLPMAAIAANPRMILSLVVLTVAPALVTIAATFYSPPYFEIVRGLTPFKAALIPLPSILLGALTSVIVSKLYHRGPRWAQGIAIIASVMQIVGGGIFYAFPQDVNIYLIHMAYITAAIGTGMTFTMGMALVFEYVPDTRYGAAASLMNLASSLGAVLGTSIYGLILRWEIRKYIEQTIARALAAIPADISEDVKSAALREAVSAHQNLMEPSPEYRTVYHDSQRYACLYLYGSAGLCSLLAALVMGRHVMAKT